MFFEIHVFSEFTTHNTRARAGKIHPKVRVAASAQKGLHGKQRARRLRPLPPLALCALCAKVNYSAARLILVFLFNLVEYCGDLYSIIPRAPGDSLAGSLGAASLSLSISAGRQLRFLRAKPPSHSRGQIVISLAHAFVKSVRFTQIKEPLVHFLHLSFI